MWCAPLVRCDTTCRTRGATLDPLVAVPSIVRIPLTEMLQLLLVLLALPALALPMLVLALVR